MLPSGSFYRLCHTCSVGWRSLEDSRLHFLLWFKFWVKMRLSLEQGTSLWALSDHRARKFRKQEQERREAALRAQEQACAHGALFKPGLSEGACVEPQVAQEMAPDRRGFRTGWEHYGTAGSLKQNVRDSFCVTSMLNGPTAMNPWGETGRNAPDANYPKRGFEEMKWVICSPCWLGLWPLYWHCQHGCQRSFALSTWLASRNLIKVDHLR